MAAFYKHTKPDKKAIRNWTLYVLRFEDETYYIGITAYKDYLRRVHQHGGRFGAHWTRNKKLREVVEIRHLGRILRKRAENIENDVTLEYRKRFGWTRVRGGYNVSVASSIIPTYTPGSPQPVVFILSSLMLAIFLLIFILTK
jgi:predicted GIY-YIG superfamily endonuclease